MKTPKITAALLAAAGALLTGCVGYNSTLFMTKSNFGLDADLKPPTLEVSLARREAVIAPTFDDAKTPPVAASFRVEPGLHVPFFPQISSTFSGGDAADLMSWLYAGPDDMNVQRSSAIPLKSKPSHKFLGFIPMRPQEPGDMQPLLFGTDTSVGLKAAWSGVAAAFPDTVKLGVNRKEFALAPIVMTESVSNRVKTYHVGMPSFLATMDNSISVTYITNLSVKHLQYFATGKAAENFARRQSVREAMVRRLDPVAASYEKHFGDLSMEIRNLQVEADIFAALERSANAGDPVAKQHVRDMNSLGELVPDEYTYIEVTAAADASGTISAARKAGRRESEPSYNTFKKYRAELADSIKALKSGTKFSIKELDNSTTTLSGASLAEQVGRYQRAADALAQRAAKTGARSRAFAYYIELLKN